MRGSSEQPHQLYLIVIDWINIKIPIVYHCFGRFPLSPLYTPLTMGGPCALTMKTFTGAIHHLNSLQEISNEINIQYDNLTDRYFRACKCLLARHLRRPPVDRLFVKVRNANRLLPTECLHCGESPRLKVRLTAGNLQDSTNLAILSGNYGILS